MAIMSADDLIARMKELKNEPNYYGSGGNNWSSWVGSGWYVDCTCSIKAILWGGRFIPENRGRAHAGCNYGSNGVPDFTPSSCVAWTNATAGHWDTILPGEIVLMVSHGHAGLYIGNGQVIEVTPAWTGGWPGCQISQLGANGERSKDGSYVYSWEYHGKIPGIDYSKYEHNRKVGEVVDINGVYVSSASTTKLVPAVKRGTITQILTGVRNPYLLNDGNIGWIGEDCITMYPLEITKFEIKEKREKSIIIGFDTDVDADWAKYMLDNNEWVDLPTSGEIQVDPDSYHTIKVRLRRKGTDLWTDSNEIKFIINEPQPEPIPEPEPEPTPEPEPIPEPEKESFIQKLFSFIFKLIKALFNKEEE